MNQRIDHLYYESIAYFTAGIMRCLDSCPHLEEETTLYRGLKLDFNSLLIYEKSKGKIILIPPFTSCSLIKDVAKVFARGKEPLFSVIFIIKFNHKNNWISNGYDLHYIAKYPKEREIIIQAFSFFYVREVEINKNTYTAEIYLETIGKKEILEKEMENGKDIEYNSIENIMQIKK
jgi:polyferredoxin